MPPRQRSFRWAVESNRPTRSCRTPKATTVSTGRSPIWMSTVSTAGRPTSLRPTAGRAGSSATQRHRPRNAISASTSTSYPTVKASRRASPTVFTGLVSPDGIHWSRLPDPLLSYFHDTENIAAWDPILEKYVGYFRGHLEGRAIARSETDDFRNWPPAEVILAAGPQDSLAADYYTNGFTTYPDDPVATVPVPGDLSSRHRPGRRPLRRQPQQSCLELDVIRPDPRAGRAGRMG